MLRRALPRAGVTVDIRCAAGHTNQTVAAPAILITAPPGAIGLDVTYKRMLAKDGG